MEIVASLLEASMKGATKTRMMYRAYVSYGQLKEYVEFLQRKELLNFDQQTQMYNLTAKGLHYLNVYSEIRDLFDLNESSTAQQSSISEKKLVPVVA
jgi:predicted transcriptional regulator